MDSVDEAVARLAETDEQIAELEADIKLLPDRIKARKGAIFLDSEGSVAERQAKADSLVCETQEFIDYNISMRKYQGLKKERETLEKRIMLFQTRLSAKAKGVVL